MSIIISIHYLLQFLIFISIIPISITIESKIKLAFINGFNVIRCSDDEVQVYQSKDNSILSISNTLTCANKKDVLDSGYAGFQWNKLKIICSSQNNQVHEEQAITRQIYSNKGIEELPGVQGQLGQSTEPYELHVAPLDNDLETTIKSNDQPANDRYFNKNTNPKERRIYLWFEDQPIICRIKLTGDQDNPCSDGDEEQDAQNVEHACYYNPGAEEQPTVKEMEAELKQVDEADKSDDAESYLLNLEKPDISTDDSSDSKPSDPSNKQPSHKKPVSQNTSKTKQKSSILKTIGLIFGILLLLILIGGIGFYLIQKNRLNKSSASSSSTNIENGDKKNSSILAPNESHQSLSANDTDRGISKNELIKKEKPTVELQKSNANKRRAGTNMVFNEDI